MSLFKKVVCGALACLLVSVALSANAARPDWKKIQSTDVLLFYPGVTSWEFLTSDDHRLGAREIKRTRRNCRHCHLSKDGELDLKAGDIAAGSIRMKRSHKAFEPEPTPGKKGTLHAAVSAAYDDEYFYLRVEWDSKGTGWLSKPGAAPDRVSVQLNAGEPSFRRYGCFVTCHNDLNTMPNSPSQKEVSGNKFYGKLKRDDVRLYAYYARNSWSEPKTAAELETLLKAGARIDLLSIEFLNGKGLVDAGWVFDDRVLDRKPSAESPGAFTSGRYTAVFKKKLVSEEPNAVRLKPGDVFTIGLAIHDDGASKRKHFVSFPVTVGLGTSADIEAERVAR